MTIYAIICSNNCTLDNFMTDYIPKLNQIVNDTGSNVIFSYHVSILVLKYFFLEKYRHCTIYYCGDKPINIRNWKTKECFTPVDIELDLRQNCDVIVGDY